MLAVENGGWSCDGYVAIVCVLTLTAWTVLSLTKENELPTHDHSARELSVWYVEGEVAWRAWARLGNKYAKADVSPVNLAFLELLNTHR